MPMNSAGSSSPSGILLVNKPRNKTSFSLVAALRRLTRVKTIGHAGTLDPFATGVMVMLIGKEYTRMSDKLLNADKEYLAEVLFGIETDSYDCDGQVINWSEIIPTEEALKHALKCFQGDVEQIPPMFSAKKVNGKKLYELARKGQSIERKPIKVHIDIELINYQYPHATMRIRCSKGTYIRSIAHDLGTHLGCGAHLCALQRTRSGPFHINNCIDGAMFDMPHYDVNTINSSLIKQL